MPSDAVQKYHRLRLLVASDTGLGGALLQDGQPAAFTSSTLSATEVNYAPIEKECLAIKVAV